MAAVTVPRGKKLSLIRDGASITGDIPLILEEDVTISLSSSFSPLFGGFSGNKAKMIDQIGAFSGDVLGAEFAFSTKFKEFGFQIWDNTDPLSINVTVTFNLGIMGRWDALTEVYRPAIALASLPLPTVGGTVGGGTLENLQPPGPPSTSLIEGDYGGKYKPISMQVGRILYVSQIIVKKAEPTFSAETDESGNPIWAKVNLDIQSVETATVETLQSRERGR
jgi:hypothetical protein